MRILVLGAGRIGTHLLRYLSRDSQNRLTVVEKRKERCREVANEFDASIINGDGSNPRILKVANLAEADMLIASTDSDTVNVTASKYAKKDFGVPRVFAIANSPRNRSLLKDSGADVVVCPVDLALQDLENMFSGKRSNTVMYRPEMDLKMVEVTIPLKSLIVGRTLKQLDLPRKKCTVTLVYRESGYVFPEPGVELHAGDTVQIMGQTKLVDETVEKLVAQETS